MNEKLKKHLDGIFFRYDDLQSVNELKEELYIDLMKKLSDFKKQGYDEESAYRMVIDSIGHIREIVEIIGDKTRELFQMTRVDFSDSDLRNYDFKRISTHATNFDDSDLREADFTGSDLTDASFQGCDLRRVKFYNVDLTRTNFDGSDLSGANFDNQTLIGTVFDNTELSGVSFRNTVFKNTSFECAEARKATFDGATMDKLTYVSLMRNNVKLSNVKVI